MEFIVWAVVGIIAFLAGLFGHYPSRSVKETAGVAFGVFVGFVVVLLFYKSAGYAVGFAAAGAVAAGIAGPLGRAVRDHKH